MKALAVLLLIPCLFSAALGEEATAVAPEEVLDAPGGKPIAILLPGAVRSTMETREGWARIRLEGWVRLPGTASPTAGPGPAPVPTAPPPEVPRGALAGTVAATLSSGEIHYGAGARVAVLGPADDLEPAWRDLKEGFEKEKTDLEGRILDLKDREKRALASSDNLTEATRSLDRARKSLGKAEKEREGIRERYARSADDLFRRHQVAEVAADIGGRYSFPALPPGKYCLLAILTTGEGVRRWYVPVEVGAQGGTIQELRSDATGPDPYFGTR